MSDPSTTNSDFKAAYKEVSRHVDQQSGTIVIVKQSDHRFPALGFDVGRLHEKQGHFTPHNLVHYKREAPIGAMDDVRRFAEGLLRICDEADASLTKTATEIVKTLPPPRKPGNNQPGKTGKTARKKAKHQASKSNGQPPAPANPTS